MTEGKEIKNESNKESEAAEESVKTAYEVGFLLVPTIAEEELEQKMAALIGEIEKHGSIRSSESIKSIDLAYGMEKKIKGKKQNFMQAYLGSIVFDAMPQDIAHINKAFEQNDEIIRFLVIKRSEKSLVAGASTPRETYVKKTDEEKGEMDEGQVDSAIEEMVSE